MRAPIWFAPLFLLVATRFSTAQVAATPGGAQPIDYSSHLDKFVLATARVNNAEVELGNLALHRSNDAQVSAMAKSILQHLMQTNENLRKLAAANKLTLPATTDDNHVSIMHDLDSKRGRQFDAAYLRVVISDCTDSVQSLRAEAGSPDPQLSSFARAEIPIFQQHLGVAQRLIEQVNDH